jgi:hypothetical protein
MHGHRDWRLDSEPEIPAAGQHLWSWFWDLNSGRQSGMGINPLSWSDIKAWEELTRNRLSPWQARVIRSMDRVYLEVAHEMSKVK